MEVLHLISDSREVQIGAFNCLHLPLVLQLLISAELLTRAKSTITNVHTAPHPHSHFCLASYTKDKRCVAYLWQSPKFLQIRRLSSFFLSSGNSHNPFTAATTSRTSSPSHLQSHTLWVSAHAQLEMCMWITFKEDFSRSGFISVSLILNCVWEPILKSPPVNCVASVLSQVTDVGRDL